MVSGLALVLSALLAAPPEIPRAVSAPKPLTPPELLADSPRFDRAGKRVVFRGGPKDQGDVYVVGVDGQGLTRLVEGPSDDRDPTFTRDGSGVVFSSNRAGTYDLWLYTFKTKALERLTDLPGDELEPSESPLEYRLMGVIDNECVGPEAKKVSAYEKVAFTHRQGKKEEVWFTSHKGKHRERISPDGQRCHSPVYSGDGLSLLFTCDTAKGPVVHDTRAVWDQDFGAAIKAVSESVKGCDEMEPDLWDSNACLKRLPRRYARHALAPLSTAADGLQGLGYSANQINALAVGQAGVASRLRAPGNEPWSPLAVALQADWSPAGDKVVLAAAGRISVADTDFYLQEVENLVDYPELWAKGFSSKLHRHHFVARPGQEKEFFTHYEKIRYAHRAPYVTVDAALQLFHDEFASLLQRAERDALDRLASVSRGLADHYAARAAKSPSDRYLALYFAVPAVLLEASYAVTEPEIVPGDEPDPNAPTPLQQIQAAVSMDKVPAALRGSVKSMIDKIFAHAGIERFPLPTEPEPALVDFSQFAVRGHYAHSVLAGYFLAATWYAEVPLPLNAEGVGTVEALKRLKGPGARPLFEDLQAVDALAASLLGQPVDLSPMLVAKVLATRPELAAPAKLEALKTALVEALGPVEIRGLEGTVTAAGTVATARPTRLRFFPKRQGLDTVFFSKLTFPTLTFARGWPSLFEALAPLGATRAKELALKAAAKEEATLGAGYAARYRETLDGLSAKYGALAPTDLYSGWLSLLVAVADEPALAKAARKLRFTQSKAWKDRTLLAALAGYTQLKHDAVLYAAQEYGVECDGGRPVMVYVEIPLLPRLRGFVDPMPTAYQRMIDLADLVYARFANGQEPMQTLPWEEKPQPINAKRFAQRLLALANKELAGQKLSKEDDEWILMVGGLMEEIFLGRAKSDSQVFGQDQGRQSRGIALVTDLFTNVTQGQVMQVGLGRIQNLFVVVPTAGGTRLTQGGIFSLYEFKQPLSDRLTDEAWGARVEKGDLPAPPAFTKSFTDR